MTKSQQQALPSSLEEIRQQIDVGLDRLLTTKGEERQALLMDLMRLKWAAESLDNNR